MQISELDKENWFAIRVTYGRELKVKEYLDNKNIKCFLPLKCIAKNKYVPAINNLLFVQSTRAQLDIIKQENETTQTMRYIIDSVTKKPAIVPNYQMENFIAVAGTLDEKLIYLTPDEILYKKGEKYKIKGGIFDGVIGELIRIKGDRRVVVKVDGFVAIATAYVHMAQLEKIT